MRISQKSLRILKLDKKMLNPSANHFSSKYPYSKIRGGGGLVFSEKKGGKCFSNGRHFDLIPQKKYHKKIKN